MNHGSINQPWLLFRSTISVRGISTWNLLFYDDRIGVGIGEVLDEGRSVGAESRLGGQRGLERRMARGAEVGWNGAVGAGGRRSPITILTISDKPKPPRSWVHI